eukprot:gene27581-34324_t
MSSGFISADDTVNDLESFKVQETPMRLRRNSPSQSDIDSSDRQQRRPTVSPSVALTVDLAPTLLPVSIQAVPAPSRKPTRKPTRLPTRKPTVRQPSSGRTIGYLAGWKTPPPVAQIASAGYTHVLVAFGVFSVLTPGQITPAFNTISAAYIASLKATGVRVMLSLGGASTDIADTTIDFHTVIGLASSSAVFTSTFVSSVQSLMSTYGFEGVDIDIESGLIPSGTFNNPMGDLAVLIAILKQLKTNNPNMLLSMAPQTANVVTNQRFDATWTNYASVIGKVVHILDWVGIQLYNTGCMLSSDPDDMRCFPNLGGNDQTFGVVMAVDVLENWPSHYTTGQLTGFQPYFAHLRADQVVLGYPIPDSSGTSDGLPTTSFTAIQNTIMCLATANMGCDLSASGFVPPRAYGLIGGVFGWEISYDQNNLYRFAKTLSPCVKSGDCS